VLETLVREAGVEAIYFKRDPDPYGRAMEQKIEAFGLRLGVPIHPHQDIALHERDEVMTASGSPFKFSRPTPKRG
jgi:deoxyribodipyrimidine photo-lyase